MSSEATASKSKKKGNPRRGKAVKEGEGPAVAVPGSAAAPVGFDAAEVAREMEMFWQSGKGDQFVMRLPDGRWATLPQQATIDRMRSLPGRMIAIKAREGEMLSEVRQVFLHTRMNRCLDEVLPSLPGYESGVHCLESGEQVLVKTSPRQVVAEKGEWPVIRQLIHGRLDLSQKDGNELPGGIDQTPWFHSWCKVALEALRRGQPGHWRAGHALILTGPGGCGKNRIQEQLITPLLGGRFADPQKFLFEGDEFNGDVFAAEHLMLSEVPLPSQRTVDRTALGEKIKQVVANPSQRMRLMRTEPCTVSPFWRLSISVNDDPDKLRSLPLITPDFGDKVLLLHCQHAPILGLDGNAPEQQKAFREAVAAELPAYAWWLENEWEIPENLRTYECGRDATRFGFREFHHPVIKGDLWEDTPAAQLLGLIDAAVFDGPDIEGGTAKLWDLPCYGKRQAEKRGKPVLAVWHDRAEDLQRVLTGEAEWTCSVATLAKKLFQHNKLTSLLARLAKDVDNGAMRVTKADDRNVRGWMIGPPVE